MSIIFSYPYPKDVYFSDLQEKLDFYYNIGLLNHKFKTSITKQYSTSPHIEIYSKALNYTYVLKPFNILYIHDDGGISTGFPYSIPKVM